LRIGVVVRARLRQVEQDARDGVIRRLELGG
jgi:hypothetical protein